MEANIRPEMQAIIRGMISANGSTLCSLIMSGMIFTFPRDCVTDGAGALMTLIEMDPQASVVWIRESLNMLPAGEPQYRRTFEIYRSNSGVYSFLKAIIDH